jgi:hypothetical protein
MKFGQPPAPPRQNPPMKRQPMPENYEERQPKPYSWKTDEFQVKKRGSARPTAMFDPAQNPTNQHLQRPIANRQGNQQMTAGYRCPRCATTMMPQTTRKISGAGWITFAVLLVFFFPLFWIGLLLKEDVLTCPVCNLRLS